MADEVRHNCNNDDRLKFIDEKIKALEDKLAELWGLTMNHDKTIAVIQTKLDNITDKIDSVITKIDSLSKKQELYESRPSEISDKIKIAVITGIIMMAVGYFFNKMIGM